MLVEFSSYQSVDAGKVTVVLLCSDRAMRRWSPSSHCDVSDATLASFGNSMTSGRIRGLGSPAEGSMAQRVMVGKEAVPHFLRECFIASSASLP